MNNIRSFIPPVKLHPILIFFIIVSIITGTFVHLFILLAIVFIHELGHFFMAAYFRWRIDKIVLWIFGGVVRTDEATNRPFKEVLLVTIAGPLQHMFIYFFLYIFTFVSWIPTDYLTIALYLNTVILIFNLLPIFPLDGGKIIFLIFSLVFPFRFAYRLTIIFSFICCITILLMQFFILPFNLATLLLICFILLENILEWKNEYYIFIRFLLHRLTFKDQPLSYRLKKLYAHPNDRLIDLFQQFMYHSVHQIYVNDKEKLTEYEALQLYFFEKNHDVRVKDIIR